MNSSNNKNDFTFPVTIITKSEEFLVECRANMKVKFLKWNIHKLKRIEPKHQRLFFEGIELEEPDLELSCYGIEPEIGPDSGRLDIEFKLMLAQFYQGIPQTYFLDESHYDSKWNCSYQGIVHNRKLNRGGKAYVQPIGCVRYGLKVLGKYEDDSWLGGKGYRTEDEWPVAYHGTKELNVLEILRKGFLIEKGVRFAYGKGIYCSPDPSVALGYAYHYTFEEKLYKLIIQCRVDPKKLQIHGNYWLVTDEKQIRPYAICVFSEDRIAELFKYLNKNGVPNQYGFHWGSQGGGGGGLSSSSSSMAVANPPLPPIIQNTLKPLPNNSAPPVQNGGAASKSNSTDSAANPK